MNATSAASGTASPAPARQPVSHPGSGAFAWPSLLIAAVLAVVSVLLAGCSRNGSVDATPGGAAETLRLAVDASEPDAWSDEVDLSVGRTAFTLARAGTHLLPVDPRIREVLRVARGAAVRVAHRVPGTIPTDAAGVELSNEAHRRMQQAGWERIVSVVHPGELVGVFVPAGLAAGDDITCAVLVRDRNELVVVAARVNPEALLRAVEEIPQLSLKVSGRGGGAGSVASE